ncbi:fa279587-802e-4e82-8d7c-307d1041a4dc [Sclerotinia trifoliorum]|uniref:Fa279587-802e-4e82-8d7c-307d1041a4dc n=1 Tax=Sclerotinia trifoliorum TaxID=28548 RepID=A0A8H2VYU6_9HELO|nr:fa279587-802e-4e82-8d7c-307d1041a4dc [Sclerotinia trifoliorum]
MNTPHLPTNLSNRTRHMSLEFFKSRLSTRGNKCFILMIYATYMNNDDSIPSKVRYAEYLMAMDEVGRRFQLKLEDIDKSRHSRFESSLEILSMRKIRMNL